jgi:hypothetical protein
MALRIVATAWTVLVLSFGCCGCADRDAEAATDKLTVRIAQQTFALDVAADDASRMRGLGGRASIPSDGGMIFIFPEPLPLSFHMKDCLVDIDIIFIDARGRITALHEMKAQPLQRSGESDAAYAARLRNYSSGARAQFAIELAAGWIDRLGVRTEDRIELDLERLKGLVQSTDPAT